MKRLTPVKGADLSRLEAAFSTWLNEDDEWLFRHGFLPERVGSDRAAVWEREITRDSYCLLAPWVPRPDHPVKTAWYMPHRGDDGLWTARVETREGDIIMKLFCGNRRQSVQRALLDALDFVEKKRRRFRFENGGKESE